jgi:hypothetical protein
MGDERTDTRRCSRHAASLPIDAIDMSDATLYQQDTWRPDFARLHPVE